jgi:uncharacterized protein (DUF2384 family)
MKKETYDELYQKVMEKGIDTFGSKIKFNRWLGHNSIALGDRPVNLTKTYDGLDLVLSELYRIDGVFS